jgi:hypothetical protein
MDNEILTRQDLVETVAHPESPEAGPAPIGFAGPVCFTSAVYV